MKIKIINIVIVVFLLLTTFSSLSALGLIEKNNKDLKFNSLLKNLQLDQQQTFSNGAGTFTVSNDYAWAQSFTPTISKICSIELLFEKRGNPTGTIVISIKEF